MKYDKNYFKSDVTVETGLLVVTYKIGKGITNHVSIDYKDDKNKYLERAMLSGDSIVLVRTKEKATKKLALEKYKINNNAFVFDKFLPIDTDQIFAQASQQGNFYFKDLYQYPYLATPYDNKIYNVVTGKSTEIIADKTFQNILENARNNGNKFVDNQIFAPTATYWHSDYKKLLVIYNLENVSYLDVFDENFNKIKSIKLSDMMIKEGKQAVNYDFDLRNKPLVVQSFKQNTNQLLSNSIDLDLLLN